MGGLGGVADSAEFVGIRLSGFRPGKFSRENSGADGFPRPAQQLSSTTEPQNRSGSHGSAFLPRALLQFRNAVVAGAVCGYCIRLVPHGA
jgi:hypothetical protein